MPKIQTDDCALCLRNNGQCGALRQSHIIPRSMHKETKRDGKNLQGLTPIAEVAWDVRDLKEYLLCNDCEQRIGLIETQAIRALKVTAASLAIVSENVEVIEKFIRSVVWRASVAECTKRHSELSPVIESDLRNHLLNGTALPKGAFQTRLSYLPEVLAIERKRPGFIIAPWRQPGQPKQASCFSTYGLVFTMYEGSPRPGRAVLVPGVRFEVKPAREEELWIPQEVLRGLSSARTPKSYKKKT